MSAGCGKVLSPLCALLHAWLCSLCPANPHDPTATHDPAAPHGPVVLPKPTANKTEGNSARPPSGQPKAPRSSALAAPAPQLESPTPKEGWDLMGVAVHPLSPVFLG